MPEYSRPLGDAVRQARMRLKLTQNEVADSIGVDPRTVLNIENYKGNPKMEVLYPLVRALRIDVREIFTPEMVMESPSVRQLRILIDSCSEQDAITLIPVVQAVLSALHRDDSIEIT